jgi:peptidoglycan/xylan/chitin deacetylase (PgdA/CDA1 family)
MSGVSRAAGRLVKAGAAVVDRLRPPARGVVVLAYHQVGGPGRGSVNLSPALFDEQMAFLASRTGAGRVVTLDHAVAALTQPAPPLDLVVITFDDGTADFVEHAVPILAKYRLPATLYLATEWVEQGRSFWDDGTVLSWAALRDALGTGLIDVGSHTHRHVLLDRIDADDAGADLDRSIGLIGEHLQVEARHFAYPKALAPSPANDREVRARFVSAALAGGGPNPFQASDPGRLARSPIVVADGMDWFARKARGGLRLEGAVRDRLDRRRYAEATR